MSENVLIFNWTHKSAKQIIDGLLGIHNIKRSHRQLKGFAGLSLLKSRIVQLPHDLSNPFKFMICLHEIGHIINYDKRKIPYKYAYISEYDAEMYALRVARQLNIVPDAYMQDYLKQAKSYVLRHMQDDIIFRGLQSERIRKDIMKWLGITEDTPCFELNLKPI